MSAGLDHATPEAARVVQEMREELAAVKEEQANRIDELESEFADTKEELAAAHGRIDELEAQPRIRWDSDKPSEMTIEHPDEETSDYPLGASIKSKASADRIWKAHDSLADDVEKVKYEGVDVTDLAGQPLHSSLPIEDAMKRYNTGGPMREALEENEKRAAVLFKAFGDRAKVSMNGRTMRLDSADVRSILADKMDEQDANSNTVKRCMKRLAEMSSTESKKDRDAYDEENLFTMGKHEGRLAVRASKQEFHEFMQDMTERWEKDSAVTLS